MTTLVELPPDPLLNAAVALLGRTGAAELTIGYVEEHDPPVWYAVAQYGRRHEAAGAMSPRKAVLRLLDTLIDGGTCVHCGKTTGVVAEPGPPGYGMPLSEVVCWYTYDPKVQAFRRGCGEPT